MFSELPNRPSRLVCLQFLYTHLTIRVLRAEVGAGFSLAHAATASLLACVTVLTILETESEY